jgi:4'-phosphopantetheinyl transferase
MPLSKIICNDTGGWALWHITESVELLSNSVFIETCPTEITALKRKLEWYASRLLMRQLTETLGLNYKGMYKDVFGKPHLINESALISLSHSYPYVAAQLNFNLPVGIDIEQPSTKLLRVAHRVFNLQEQHDAGTDLTKNCVYWCAKEALYKLYGKRGLSFTDNIIIEPFSLMAVGELVGIIITKEIKLEIVLSYQIEKDSILVYTKF